MKPTALDIQNASVYYGELQALQDVSLYVNEGEVVALIGSNGAGKTTLLHAVSGLLSPRSGEIFFHGQAINGLAPENIAKLGLSHVPERWRLFTPMTVMDNLALGTYALSSRTRKEESPKILKEVFEIFPILKERVKQVAGTLSGGEQQMLALARGLMSKPTLLLLDEPSLGLAPMLVKNIMEVIEELRSHGMTVLLVEQNAKAALKIADRGYVLERGQIILQDSAKELVTNDLVRTAYLGGSLLSKITKKSIITS